MRGVRLCCRSVFDTGSRTRPEVLRVMRLVTVRHPSTFDLVRCGRPRRCPDRVGAAQASCRGRIGCCAPRERDVAAVLDTRPGKFGLPPEEGVRRGEQSGADAAARQFG